MAKIDRELEKLLDGREATVATVGELKELLDVLADDIPLGESVTGLGGNATLLMEDGELLIY